MKIIYLANIRFPTEKAHGVHFAKMCEALARLGNQVELWTAGRYNPDFKGVDPYEFYAVARNFEIKKLFVFDILRFVINKSRLGTWLINLSFAETAWWRLLFTKYDLVYSRDALPLLLLSLVSKKFVYELHEYRKKDAWVYRKLAKSGQSVVVITNGIKELLLKDGVEESKLLVAADGVSDEISNVQYPYLAGRQAIPNIRTELRLTEGEKVILYTGSLYKWKGVFTLAQIFNTRHPISKDCVIVFVGGMEYDVERLKNFIKDNDLPEEKIKILGHKPYNEIPKYLAVADVLVLPNSGKKEISSQYTSPLKMFEYMAAGKPIVASDLPSIREVLNPNNSILVQPDDPESLAEGIMKALTDNKLVNKIVVQAKQDVKEYSWDKRAEKILKFLKKYGLEK